MQILHITNMQATIEQLEILKKSNAIPLNTPKCDLITKSNAERLVSMFINNQPYLIDNEIKQTLNGIEVNIFLYILRQSNFMSFLIRVSPKI